jgi:plasmid stabilization system protein ParE
VTKPLIVRSEAEADLSEAYQWYEERVAGLGEQFLLSLDATMASIEREPQLYPVVYKGIVRRALIRRFPFGVYFINGERSTSVIGVVHAKRNPRVWRSRV